MLFGIGTRVKFLHTGDTGIVKRLLENGMVEVYLEGEDMSIPVFEDDLIRDESTIEPKSVKAKFVKGKSEKEEEKPVFPNIKTQYRVLRSEGLQMTFDPVFLNDAHPEKYIIYILNDTNFEILYNIEFFLNGALEDNWNGKLEAHSYVQLGNLFYDELNDYPTFEIKVNRLSTAGRGETQMKSLKIKPKQFFKNIKTAPFLNKSVHWYLLFKNFESENQKDNKEDLKSYTIRKAKPIKDSFKQTELYDYRNPAEFAAFESEIDLHIQNLVESHVKMSNAEIVRIQLSHFDAYIYKALRMGVSRVFIIHGVGKGKLKDEIASRLITNPDVETFKNEFHPRYGWGATEVIFK